MKAAYITRTGPPDVITFGELPTPKPGPSDCLVQVIAVDVNPVDSYVRSGAIASGIQFPYILGRDLAGTVIEVGANVKRFKPGDRVWASNQGFAGRQGTFSEFAALDELWLHAIPAEVRDEDIVAVSLVGITAHLGLFQHAKLKAEETIFVNGGSGGVGSCVVQMAKIIGAKVITTAGSEEKVGTCRKLGADVAVNYKTQDVDAAIKAFAPKGLNVWWETLREPNFERAVPLLAMRGRMVIMAGRDAKPTFPVGQFYTKDCSLFGFAMFNSSAAEHHTTATDINKWMADGRLRAQIDRVMPLSETAAAHRLQEESTVHKSGALTGKIVLKP
jgi:NADPH2:quinone reductase